MIIGEQVVACMGIRKHEGVKCLAIYGIGEYLGEQILTDEHHLHPKERFGQPRFAQPMAKIGLVANNKLARFLLRAHWMFQANTVSTLNNRLIKADRSRTRNSGSYRRSHSSN